MTKYTKPVDLYGWEINYATGINANCRCVEKRLIGDDSYTNKA